MGGARVRQQLYVLRDTAVGVTLIQATPSDAHTTSLCVTVLPRLHSYCLSLCRCQSKAYARLLEITGTKGTMDPEGARLLIFSLYYMCTASPACA